MHESTHAEGPLTPGLVFDMLQAHQRTAALKAAIDLDVFRAVGEGPGDVASIAKHCSASERGIRILCDFLAIYGVLVKDDGHYRHSATSAAFLTRARLHRLLPLRSFSAMRQCASLTTIWRMWCAPGAQRSRAMAAWSRRIQSGCSLRRPWRP